MIHGDLAGVLLVYIYVANLLKCNEDGCHNKDKSDTRITPLTKSNIIINSNQNR